MKINGEEWFICTPWHNIDQLASFMYSWGTDQNSDAFIFQQDASKLGCATTKNMAILEAKSRNAAGVVILDDDCFRPFHISGPKDFIELHIAALQVQPVEMFHQVTEPASRGTPYFDRTVDMPVAASMGFWTGIGDYDAPSQLVHGAKKTMAFKTDPIFGKYFPLCGMNLAFKLDWIPWCWFIDVPRFDDIWQGFLWQKEAYRKGFCFNLNGPAVVHSRQSNVWANLRDETINLERNETLWKKIHLSNETDYNKLTELI